MNRQQIVDKVNNFTGEQAEIWLSKYPDCKSIDEAIDRELLECNMRIQPKEQLFESHKRLIYKQAWYYANKYNMDFEDVKSQAFLIFCEMVDRYDGRAYFSTFLHHNMKQLNDYCREQRFGRPAKIEDVSTIPATNWNEERILFTQLVNQLSPKGKMLVHGLVSGVFERPERKRRSAPGKMNVIRMSRDNWGWKEVTAYKVWDEVQDWWKKNNQIFLQN